MPVIKLWRAELLFILLSVAGRVLESQSPALSPPPRGHGRPVATCPSGEAASGIERRDQ